MRDNDIATTLGRRFDEMAEAYPGHKAIEEDGGASMTYSELRAEAGRLASGLAARGVSAGSRVGLLLGKSIDMALAMLAAVKLGACYVPLSEDDPEPHLERLAADAGAELVIARRDVSLSGIPVLPIGQLRAQASAPAASEADSSGSESPEAESPEAESSGAAASEGASPDSLAYILFTSGTTGMPKGVGVTHDNIVNLVLEGGFVELGADTRILQTGAPTFDASTFEIWGALLNGGTLIVPAGQGLTDFDYMERAVRKHGITTMWLTSPLFTIAAEQKPELFRGIRDLIVGGDVVHPASVRKVQEACPELQVLNGYGPTECTTFSAVYPIGRGLAEKPIPLGMPIGNAEFHILDENGQPVPPGEIGELHIGGRGVAAGYVNRPEATAEAFLDNPFGAGRIYRSGDRASRDAEGLYHYWGRKDRQVKIRGYRIELAAVESILRSVGIVESAVAGVIENEAGLKELCCCATLKRGVSAGREELRRLFGELAPSHLVLSRIVLVDELPLNKNGKTDSKAIAELFAAERAEPPEDGSAADAAPAAEPSICDTLAAIISKRTGFRLSGPDVSFFELGIDSLTAVYLARDINARLGAKLSAADILAHPTLGALAERLDGGQPAGPSAGSSNGLSVETSLGEGTGGKTQLPLLNEQKPLFIDFQLHPGSVRYNTPLLLELDSGISLARLEEALEQAVLRHDALRTRYFMSGGRMLQRIQAREELRIERLQGKPDLDELIRPFDLAAQPPFRFAFLEEGGRAWLFMDFHHIAVDGHSLGILVRDVGRLYSGQPLEDARGKFASAVLASEAACESGRAASLAFWKEELRAFRGMPELPIDRVDAAGHSKASRMHRFRIGEERTAALRAWAQSGRTTVFESLLTVYAATLHAVTSGQEVVFATPVRDYAIPEGETVAAMLTRTLWVRSELIHGQSVDAYREKFVARLRRSQPHGNVPIDEIRRLLQPEGTSGAVGETLIAYHTAADMQAEWLGRQASLRPAAPPEGMFPLNLQIYDGGDQMEAEWEYMSELFEPDTMSSLGDMFAFMLDLLTHPYAFGAESMPDLVAACLQKQMA
ncbi:MULTISPECIES: non-ribosomal peptide synthetase [unclassified Paenibacillus]|uniref:non-ribosomal peptide synthetase n=1 Tax=unclassified Paenibacillus TaxID=185978 RepID=UPI00095405E7|nr:MULTISPECIES: non-ribosomal peptide synthetase [unclassified Paenibacillus]ASS67090.1 non-ribosomal peptide synthetase [Paenibacillus sp. RUD330]SIQ90504.1 amino acid adenylation domain-containing protein [Paenibacillus sp. RU4X]SIR11371.1 amino acid adenylation domain-containing protein [Paenibacillus sp. RU4T]